MGRHSNLVSEKLLTWFTCNYLSPIAEKQNIYESIGSKSTL